MGEAYHRPDQKTLQALKDMANKLRIHSIESTNTAGSGYVNEGCRLRCEPVFLLDFSLQASNLMLLYRGNNVRSVFPHDALQR